MRLAAPAGALVEQAQVPVRVGEVGVGADRGLVARQRLVGALGVLEHDAQVVPGERAVGLVADRLAEVRFGADEVAVGVQQPSEVDARDDVAGLEVERVMVGGARLERRALLDLHGEVAPLRRR